MHPMNGIVISLVIMILAHFLCVDSTRQKTADSVLV